MVKKILPYAGYLLVIFILFIPILPLNRTSLIFGDDIHRQYYFYREFFNTFFEKGIMPWWNPYLFGGNPFIANPVVNIWYPPTWLFMLFPITSAYPLHLALHVFMAMAGMYWLGRRWLSRSSSWTAGLVFGLSGFFMARIWAGHVDVIAAASFMPWVFGAFWNLLDKGDKHNSGRRIALASGLFALQLYAGYQTMAFFTIVAIGIATLLFCFIHKDIKSFVRVIAAGIIGLGLAGLQLIPEQEFFRNSIRTYSFPYSWNAYGAATLDSLKQLVNPFIFGDQLSYYGPPPNYPEHAMFIGIIALVLAVFAVIGLLKFPKLPTVTTEKLPIAVFLLIVIFSLWISLAGNAFFDLQKFAWQIIPMYHYLRFPSRHLILFVFAASALSGFGFELIRSVKRVRGTGEIVVITLILLELVPFARHFIAVREIPEARHDKNLLALLKQDREPYRVLPNFGVWVPPRDSFDFDSAAGYGIFSATGYDPSILRSYYEFFDAANGNNVPSILEHDVQVPYLNVDSPYTNFLNIKYILMPRGYDSLAGTTGERFKLLSEDTVRDYRLYQNLNVLPRFFFVNTAEYLPAAEIKSRIQSNTADLATTVLVDESSFAGEKLKDQCPTGAVKSIQIKSYSPNTITLNVSTPCDTYLVSSEVWYPGWTAYVDGKKTGILRSNISFRTVFIPKGNHTVLMTYSPGIFVFGLFVSLVSFGILIILRKVRS